MASYVRLCPRFLRPTLCFLTLAVSPVGLVTGSPRVIWEFEGIESASAGSAGGPTISLKAEPEQVSGNGVSTLRWSVQHASRCQASGGWSGERPLSGSLPAGPLARSTSYTLSCEGAGGNALATVTVEVLDRTLRWQAPTQNVDGTPLTDLAGFVVYWGFQTRGYFSSLEIDDPTARAWEADLASGTYFFALTAVDADGNESAYSNEVRKTIP